MKREEYNEIRHIRSSLKTLTLDYGTTLTIRTDASAEYKHKLDELYTSLNFHPASVRIDRRMYDDKERIILHLFKDMDRRRGQGTLLDGAFHPGRAGAFRSSP